MIERRYVVIERFDHEDGSSDWEKTILPETTTRRTAFHAAGKKVVEHMNAREHCNIELVFADVFIEDEYTDELGAVHTIGYLQDDYEHIISWDT